MAEPWYIEDMGDFLLVKVTGTYSGVPFADTAIAAITDQCRALQRWRVLIDLRDMHGSVPNIDRFLLGKHAANAWGRRIKVAVITHPERMTRFFENVAVNQGGNVRTFTDRNEAQAWLLSGSLS